MRDDKVGLNAKSRRLLPPLRGPPSSRRKALIQFRLNKLHIESNDNTGEADDMGRAKQKGASPMRNSFQREDKRNLAKK